MENYDQNAKELRGSFNNISDTQGNCTLKELHIKRRLFQHLQK